jgi:ABC-2 type transport system permease protein
MRKIMVIAIRDYLAAVKTKSFIISLVMMPVLMGGSAVIQVITKKLEDAGEKRFAIVDRSPDQKIFAALQAAAERRNEIEIFDPDTKKQKEPRFVLERIEPSLPAPEAMKEQRYELSQEVLGGKYFGFLEIGSDVYTYAPLPRPKPSSLDELANVLGKPLADKVPDPQRLRYQSKTPQYSLFSRWATAIVNEVVQQKRWADAKQSRAIVQAIQQPVPIAPKGLSSRSAQTGMIQDAATENQVVQFMVPAILVVVIFLMIMVGATPLVGSIMEEKMQRIAEVLLGSVRPFDLMMGKLLGTVAVSLTIVSFYLVGGFWAASHYGFADLLSPGIIAWFFVYLVLAILMYGSLFIAVGAACTEAKEAQTMLMPVIMIAVIPMFVLVNVAQEPNGLLATTFSFFPFATPMLMMARQAVPPGIPWWQPVLGMILVLATTTLCVYAAGRIFRVGILMIGKGAKMSDLLKWVFSG